MFASNYLKCVISKPFRTKNTISQQLKKMCLKETYHNDKNNYDGYDVVLSILNIYNKID
jgi:hypothetical protein